MPIIHFRRPIALVFIVDEISSTAIKINIIPADNIFFLSRNIANILTDIITVNIRLNKTSISNIYSFLIMFIFRCSLTFNKKYEVTDDSNKIISKVIATVKADLVDSLAKFKLIIELIIIEKPIVAKHPCIHVMNAYLFLYVSFIFQYKSQFKRLISHNRNVKKSPHKAG